jgi:hypothetical protein
MRLNRATILLVIGLLVIIVGALLLNSAGQPAAQPTPQPTSVTVRVFPYADGTRAVRLEIRSNTTGVSTTLTRDPSFLWQVAATGATVPTVNRIVDQVAVPGFLSSFAQLASTESFQQDQLSSFKLDQPSHTITMTSDDGGVYTLHIGETNLAGGRYFAIAETTAGSGAPAPTAMPTSAFTPTPEETTPTATVTATTAATATQGPSPTPTATATALVNLSGMQTIYLVPKSEVDALIALIQQPPYTPLPTATPTPFPTANPYSEVDQTATAAVQQTATMTSLMLTATASAPSATPEAAISTPEVTPQITTEATAAPTVTPLPTHTLVPDATATPRP